jgi:hypothetical protein
VGLSYPDLDERTRQLMLAEVARDEAEGRLYLSQRLSARGLADYPSLLRDAIERGTDDSLATALRSQGRLNAQEQKRKPSGGYTVAAVPVTAAETLAEGEFNRFYARALCLRALEDGLSEVEVHRAKQVQNPRSASQAKIGQRIPARALLEDLRTHPGVDTALGLPPGPNSGLSVRMP